MDTENFDSKKLFLEAVLAEYKRLTEEMMTHNKNMSYLLAVLVGGAATILGFLGFEIASFLIIPIFVSSCGALMLTEGFSAATVQYYIVEEIENNRLRELFPHGSPIRYDSRFQSRLGNMGLVFWGGLFVLSSCVSLACLIASTLVWSQVTNSIFYQSVYFFGWITLAFYVISATLGFLSLRHGPRKVGSQSKNVPTSSTQDPGQET
jgi:hypothetical protein